MNTPVKKVTLKYYQDPGHGWVKVSKKFMEKINMPVKLISTYSYMRGEYAYLEEDCDATLLQNTLLAQGYTIKYVENYAKKSSKIRNYDSYKRTQS